MNICNNSIWSDFQYYFYREYTLVIITLPCRFISLICQSLPADTVSLITSLSTPFIMITVYLLCRAEIKLCRVLPKSLDCNMQYHLIMERLWTGVDNKYCSHTRFSRAIHNCTWRYIVKHRLLGTPHIALISCEASYGRADNCESWVTDKVQIVTTRHIYLVAAIPHDSGTKQLSKYISL